MKCDSSVVINAGNLLHCLNFDLEKGKCGKKSLFTSNLLSGEENPNHASLVKFAQQNFRLFSPPHAPSVTSDSDFASDCESELGLFPVAGPSNGRRKRPSRKNFMSEERLQRVAEFSEQLSPPNSGLRSFVAWHGIKRRSQLPTALDSTKKRAADKAYELTDENFEADPVQEKLSTFRRKRLAEKKYAFNDDEVECDLTSLSQLRKQSQSTSSPLEQPQPSTSQVLRPLSANTDLSDLFEVPELLSPGGMVKKDQSLASPRSSDSVPQASASSSGVQQTPPRFHAKFTRKFIELDEEAISVMTEVEDDDLGASMIGYHPALPLEVHGTAYQPMAMISNGKAEKLGKKCLKISQTSLDVELLCHDMAEKLCSAAGKKYWFCNDYDVEIVDLDPNSEEVLCVAVVQVRATVVKTSTKVSTDENYSYSSLRRHLYQGGFKFSWNISTGQYYVVDSEPLQEILREPAGFWHPARGICLNLQKQWKCFSGGSEVRCMTNDSVINDTSLKTIVDSENFVAIILDDLR